MPIDLEYRTKGWTERRVILQYDPNDGTRKYERDREEMASHGYVAANVISEPKLVTAVYVNYGRPEPPRPIAKPQPTLGVGTLRTPLRLRGLRAFVVATSDGFESEWHVELVFAPPDKRFIPVDLWLSPREVDAFAKLLRSAESVLTDLPDRLGGDFSRTIGTTKGVSVSVRAAPGWRGVRVTAVSRTRQRFGPALTADDLAAWVNELEAAEDEGEALRRQLEGLSR